LPHPVEPGEQFKLPADELGEVPLEEVVRILEPHERFQRPPPTGRALERGALTQARAVAEPCPNSESYPCLSVSSKGLVVRHAAHSRASGLRVTTWLRKSGLAHR
jgi:hypothetical protein